MVTRDEGDDVYPGSGPPMEVKPYILLGCIDVYEDYRVDLPRDQVAKTLDELVCPLQSKPYGLYRHRVYLVFTHGKLPAGNRDADLLILTWSACPVFGGFLLEYGVTAYPAIPVTIRERPTKPACER